MSFEKYNGKGLNGLANLGNTCFMNSVLQCLAHTYELYNIEKESKTNEIFDIKIFDEYFKLIHFMWDEDSTVSPNGFLKYVKFVAKKKDREMFTGFDQNDFTEFLLFMISCLHESIKKNPPEIKSKSKIVNDYLTKEPYKNDYSELTKIFNGILINTVYDKETDKEVNQIVDQFTVLHLHVPERQNITIEDCLDEYFKEIELCNEDKYVLPDNHPDAGKRIDALGKWGIWSLPQILILNLLRVKIVGNKMIKKENLISYGETINLDKYCLNKENNNNYELYAIGEHHGNIYGGHYTCLIKTANQKWYRFNDMSVKQVKNNNTNRAYTFFYRKNL